MCLSVAPRISGREGDRFTRLLIDGSGHLAQAQSAVDVAVDGASSFADQEMVQTLSRTSARGG